MREHYPRRTVRIAFLRGRLVLPGRARSEKGRHGQPCEEVFPSHEGDGSRLHGAGLAPLHPLRQASSARPAPYESPGEALQIEPAGFVTGHAGGKDIAFPGRARRLVTLQARENGFHSFGSRRVSGSIAVASRHGIRGRRDGFKALPGEKETEV